MSLGTTPVKPAVWGSSAVLVTNRTGRAAIYVVPGFI